MSAPDNRARMRALIEGARITQAEAARLIGEWRGEPLDPRTVRGWLADPALPSARRCPGWAARALADTLAAGVYGQIGAARITAAPKSKKAPRRGD